MELEEIRQRKEQLKSDIMDLILNFEKDTDLQIESISSVSIKSGMKTQYVTGIEISCDI